jgi:hypothetical protein
VRTSTVSVPLDVLRQYAVDVPEDASALESDL